MANQPVAMFAFFGSPHFLYPLELYSILKSLPLFLSSPLPFADSVLIGPVGSGLGPGSLLSRDLFPGVWWGCWVLPFFSLPAETWLRSAGNQLWQACSFPDSQQLPLARPPRPRQRWVGKGHLRVGSHLVGLLMTHCGHSCPTSGCVTQINPLPTQTQTESSINFSLGVCNKTKGAHEHHTLCDHGLGVSVFTGAAFSSYCPVPAPSSSLRRAGRLPGSRPNSGAPVLSAQHSL